MYTAHRDERFYHVSDVIFFIENTQCNHCKFKSTEDPEFSMCDEIALDILLEKPVEDLEDVGDEGIVCNRYEVEVYGPGTR